MKYIFILLLFITPSAYSQISLGTGSSSSSFSAGTSVAASVSLVAGKPTLWFIESHAASSPVATPTITTSGYTWIPLATVETNADASLFVRQTLFICYPTANGTNVSTTISWGSQNQTWNGWGTFNVTAGVNVRAFQTVTATGNGTDPAITLAALQGNNNAVAACFTNDFNPFGGAAETGWTLSYNSGGGTHGTNGAGHCAVQRNNHSDNTVQVTDANSGPWCGIAVELRRIQTVFTN